MRKGYLTTKEARMVIQALERRKRYSFGDTNGYVEYISIENSQVRVEVRSTHVLNMPSSVSYMTKEDYIRKIKGKRHSKFLELLE